MISGRLFTSTKTISGSERLGKIEILWTKVGFVVKKRSSMF